ncbi:hypothetical protein ACP4OV_015408 [Aristida adscensionis]
MGSREVACQVFDETCAADASPGDRSCFMVLRFCILAYPRFLFAVPRSNLVHGDGFLAHDCPLYRHS